MVTMSTSKVAAIESNDHGSTPPIPQSPSINNNDMPTSTIQDDILHDIDQDQLQDYKQMLLQLGEYPDKVLINTLTMIAEDYSKSYPKSSLEIYNVIKELLLSHSMKPGCKLPLVYVIDSILKNARGLFVDIMKDDFDNSNSSNNSSSNNDNDNDNNWMQDVFQFLDNDEPSKQKLRIVWNTWEQFNIFPNQTWTNIGKCFIEEDKEILNAKLVADAKAKAAGIERMTDGTLKISKKLRMKMQIVLDEVQADDSVNELDKVSLERLADINPDLLVEIKKAAEDIILQEQNEGGGGDDGMGGSKMMGTSDGMNNNLTLSSSIFQELRTPNIIEQCEEWENLKLNYREDASGVIKKLLHNVRSGTSTVQPHAMNQDQVQLTTDLFGAAAATANYLTSMLERLKTQDHNRGVVKFKAGSIRDLTGNMFFQGSKVIDKSKFTNEGLQEKNDAVIARLYDGGLAFVSSADGRRFASQLELSKHLDALFRKNQLEKSMERTDERGWYESDLSWCGIKSTTSGSHDGIVIEAMDTGPGNQLSDPALSMVTADESRDKCVICGINFAMKFHEDDGEFKYENCKEIEVLNDDVAEEESEMLLAHVTCLRGLGSPDVLTRDQVLDIA